MNITYTQNGDYLIPNIIIRKTKPIGHYGRLRKAYLEMHRPILFNELVLSDKLFEHCAEIDEAAESRKPNGMGAADERLQGTGRGSYENRIDIRLSEEVRTENCPGFSHIVQSCGRIVHRFYGII